MGLGLLGRGVGDVKFLTHSGAKLIVTDLKSAKELTPSLRKLKKFKNIKYVLGCHRFEDFNGRDFILKAAGVPLDSPYIAAARKHGVPVEMSTTLFAKLAAGIMIVGVTGTRGKSTTAKLIYEILKQAGYRVWLGGNVRGVSTLAFLPKVRTGDIAVLELDSWQLQGFGEAKISPHIAVFTNFLSDHLNYYRGDAKRYFADKANIFRYQKQGDYLLVGQDLKKTVPKSWKIKLLGEHNLNNIALAIKTAEILDVPRGVIKKTVEHFRSVPGRLELVRVWRGIKIYNDTTATIPDATIAALRAVGQPKKKNIILIAGGADKNLDMTDLIEEIPRYCKTLILLPGTGTKKFKMQKATRLPDGQEGRIASQNLKEAVEMAVRQAKRGDTILFSPAFASFGLFKNEFDRGKKFNQLVKSLK